MFGGTTLLMPETSGLVDRSTSTAPAVCTAQNPSATVAAAVFRILLSLASMMGLLPLLNRVLQVR